MTAILLGALAVITLCTCGLVGVLLRAKTDDPYVPEAAEAPLDPEPRCGIRPDPVDEHFKTSPRVVAGSDLDRQKAIAQAMTDATFAEIVLAVLTDLDAYLSAYYVLPEGDR